MTNRNFRFGNLAHVGRNVGQTSNHAAPILAQCISAFQDTVTGFWRVNCQSIRFGTPFNAIPVITQVQPLANSMGLVVFSDGDQQTPYFLPCGW